MVLEKDADTNIMDTEWIEEYEAEDNSYKMFYPETISRIKASILYINKKNELEKIREEMIYLSVPNMIKREELIHLIKSHNITDAIKYKLVSILVYNIDIQHNELKNYLNGYERYDFITNLQNIDDYELKSTLAYLQKVNNIYIIFNEKEEEKPEIQNTIKRICTDSNNSNISSSSNSSSSTKHKNTKRVKFNLPNKKTKRRKH